MTQRVTFDFSNDALERLDKMRKDGETRASVIRRALRVLEWFDQFSEDTKLIVEEPGEDAYTTTIGALTHAK